MKLHSSEVEVMREKQPLESEGKGQGEDFSSETLCFLRAQPAVKVTWQATDINWGPLWNNWWHNV